VTVELAAMTWREVEARLRDRPVGLLPIGAIEAHGPHLPLETDVIISLEMARRAAREIGNALIFPPLVYSAAPFAADFPGTISVGGQVGSVVHALKSWTLSKLCLVNSHLDPEHLGELRGVAGVVFPDKTRKPWASELPEEFKRGGPHGGKYETSLVMAARPESVREEIRRKLKPINVDLGKAIRDGARALRPLGPDGYLGDPAAATAEEGERIFGILTRMIVESMR
jgi:creatinine amidohydrolase